jgi:hypothetical protein
MQVIKETISTGRKTLPLYAVLTFVPTVVLQIKKFIRNPIPLLWSTIVHTLQSTSFLAAYVGIYMAIICAQRKVVSRDHRSIYMVAGFFASFFACLIEKKSKRSELALYVLPRAIDVVLDQIVDRKLAPSIPYGEMGIFSIAAGGLMYFFHKEPSVMSSQVLWLQKILFQKTFINIK